MRSFVSLRRFDYLHRTSLDDSVLTLTGHRCTAKMLGSKHGVGKRSRHQRNEVLSYHAID